MSGCSSTSITARSSTATSSTALARLMPITRHVQIASVPSRNEPDGEELNFPYLFAELDRLGFDGYVGAEYRPRGKTVDGLGWFAPYKGKRRRSPDERSDIRGRAAIEPGYRFAHPGYDATGATLLVRSATQEEHPMTPPQAARKAEPAISDIVMMDALPLGRALRAKQLSCVEVMNAYLDHIDRFNPKVNAIISMRERKELIAEAAQRDEQLRRGEDMGPLHGMPQAIKDLAATKGIPHHARLADLQGHDPGRRCADRRARAQRRRDPDRQDQRAGIRPRLADLQSGVRPDAQRLRPDQDVRRIERRRGGRAGAAHAAGRRRQRSRWLAAQSRRLQQRARLPHLLRPRAASPRGPLPDRPERQGTDGAHGGGPADAAVGAGRLRRSRAAVDRRSAHLCGRRR